jgi:hypothetical protein
VCTSGSNSTSWNRQRSLKFWQKFQDEYGMCSANYMQNTIQINHQPDATIFQFIIPTFVYSSICFGSCPAHHQELNDCSGNLRFYLLIVVTVVLCSWSGRTQHDCHHDTKVKPEVATAVIKLLMMGGTTLETC